MKHVAIYIRVSTREQKIDGSSIDEQKRLCIELAKKKYPEFEIKIYDDRGESSKNFNRASLLSLKRAIDEDLVEIILAYDLDRIHRDILELLNFLSLTQKKSVSLKFIVTNIGDLTNPDEELIMLIKAVVGHYELKKISQRTMMGLRGAYEKGFHARSGKPPFGFKRLDKHFSIDESQAPAVNEIINLFISSYMGYTKIADYIQLKYKIKMHTTTVKKILFSEIYRGYITAFNKKFFLHFAYIDEHMSQKIAAKANLIDKYRDNVYLFTGKLLCSACGSTLSGVSGYKIKKRYLYYRCNNKRCICYNLRISETIVENKLHKYLKEIYTRADENTINLKSNSAIGIESLSEKMNAIKIQKKRLVKLYTTGRIDELIYDTEIKQIQKKEDRIYSKIKELDFESEHDRFLKKRIIFDYLDCFNIDLNYKTILIFESALSKKRK